MNDRARHPAADLWALHALDLLDDDERATLDHHLAECAACRALVAEDRAALEPAPGDAPGHVPAEILARWGPALREFGATERGLYVRHLESCAECSAILRRLAPQPVRARVAVVAPRARVFRPRLAFALAAAAVVAVAILLGPGLFAPPRGGSDAPSIARGPDAPSVLPAPPGADSTGAPDEPGESVPTPIPDVGPDSLPTAPGMAAPVPVPVVPVPSIPSTAVAEGIPVLLRPASEGPPASRSLADAVARALEGAPGLIVASGGAADSGRFAVRATLSGAPSRAGDAASPPRGGPRGSITWELVDRYTGERVTMRSAMLDSAQAPSAAARMARQVAEAMARAPWAGRVRSAEAARVVIESEGGTPPPVGTVIELFARGRERIDAVTQAVEGYEWIRVARARVVLVRNREVEATPIEIGQGERTLRDATLARIQGPQ